MKEFVAIDFETANENRTSVCSVGIVIVRDGKMVERIHRIIRPNPNYYSSFCTAVHGMTFNDTANAPYFPEVWEEITPFIEGLPLVAHNSRFDEGCLKAAHQAYNMNYPDYTFYDTLKAARNIFGKSLPNHKLHTVSAACGYNLVNHHNALADAEACAIIAMNLFSS